MHKNWPISETHINLWLASKFPQFFSVPPDLDGFGAYYFRFYKCIFWVTEQAQNRFLPGIYAIPLNKMWSTNTSPLSGANDPFPPP
jgi:hypothetical protein